MSVPVCIRLCRKNGPSSTANPANPEPTSTMPAATGVPIQNMSPSDRIQTPFEIVELARDVRFAQPACSSWSYVTRKGGCSSQENWHFHPSPQQTHVCLLSMSSYHTSPPSQPTHPPTNHHNRHQPVLGTCSGRGGGGCGSKGGGGRGGGDLVVVVVTAEIVKHELKKKATQHARSISFG